MVFYGEYEVAITSGGRIALPKKVRDLLTDKTLVLTKGFSQCLAGYDKGDWETRAQNLLDVSLLEKENIDKRRMLFGSTVYLETDDQGRVVLPKQLRDFAGLKKKIIVVGVGDHFEIWHPERWQLYLNNIQ
ncbi:division/cell wall cluster transcriptional repressor MraZ [Candidatus Woesebacteria bacterium]|nr:division/cell wall cluster transcriptional repressor MraZ [Candidatus Woesebacteria bacterium]